MNLTEITQVLDAALPVAGLRTHLRLGSGFAEDELQDGILSSFLRAALAAIEAQSGKILIERDFELIATDWKEISPLPVAPVSTVSRVALLTPLASGESAPVDAVVAGLGVATEFDLADFQLVKDAQVPMLRSLNATLPTLPTYGGVQVQFTAGMASDLDGLPADLQQAVLMLAAHYYENRSDLGLPAGCMPFGVSSLIARYRTVRLGFGL